jgi:hypothetical protein
MHVYSSTEENLLQDAHKKNADVKTPIIVVLPEFMNDLGKASFSTDS